MGGGKSKKQTIGYRYFLGLHLILCYGPVDEILQMRIGDRTMYRSTNGGGDDPNLNSNDIYVVRGKLNLFGGEKREGGVGATGEPVRENQISGGGFFDIILQTITPPAEPDFGTGGDFEVFLGEPTQGQSAYLQARIGNDVPAYRSVCGIVFQSFYIGQNPYVKDMEFRVTRYPNVIPGDTPGNEIVSNDANPAHMLWEVLTNVDWGMGYTNSDLDSTSFLAASATLKAEGFGMSLIWGASQQIEDFIQEILRHINGSLYLDRETGLFVLRLIRDDYTPASLPLYDETNIIEMVSWSRKGWGETVNEVTVVYTARNGQATPVTVQDMANIQVQGGQVINQKEEYPGITRESIALRVASRDLQTVSTPLSRVEFTINREAWDVATGDVFRLSWPEYGILEVVFRVGSVNYGTLKDGSIRITAIEDVFGLPAASYGQPQPSQWVEPRNAPQDITNFKVYESNYWDLVQNLGETEAATFIDLTPEDGFYFVAAPRPTSDHYLFDLMERPNGTVQVYQDASAAEDFCPYCELEFDMETGFDTTFTYINDMNMNQMPLAELICIDGEYMQVYEIDQPNRTIRVMRGMLDTLPVAHSANAGVYAVQSFAAVSETQYTEGETVQIKIISTAGLGELPEDDATPFTYTFTGRAGRPWNAGNLQIEGLPAFQPQGMTSGVLNLTWKHRDKTQQTGAFVYQNDPDIGPEAGVTYTLRLYNEDNVLSLTQTGVTDNFFDWTDEGVDSGIPGRVNNSVRVELVAVDNLIESHQSHDYLFRRADYGYSYGYFYGGYI